MKYPQLVSMPSCVQEWLDEQLEARGIDAVVYTRHVLSLLQRDTLDLPEDGLPYRPKKCGIEKLVDDLCTKLNEIKSQGDRESSVVLELSEAAVGSAEAQSPRDEARKYYAAFPPLSGTGKKNVWGCGSGSGNKGAGIAGSEAWEEDKENKVAGNAAACAWGEAGGALTPRRLYQRRADSPASPGLYEGEQNLARLIAKFDESIEALWSPPGGTESPPAAAPGCFIPAGTNITSSIWSDCTEDSIAADYDCLRQTDIEPPTSGARDCGAVGSRHDGRYAMLCQSVEQATDDLCYDPSGAAAAWSDTETLPSFFASLPFGLGYALGDATQAATGQKWSDLASPGGRLADNLVHFQRSVRRLNHSRASSSFVEVQPGGRSAALPPLAPRGGRGAGGAEGEEEDLLTSPRTHFKPIKQEGTDARGYADGTTFLIPDGLEVLPFKRCPSGTLYLDAQPSPKYREYKEKEPYGGRLGTADFVPKFRVCAVEKWCQTEAEAEAEAEAVVSKRCRSAAQAGWRREQTACFKCSSAWHVPGGGNTVQPWADIWSGTPCPDCTGGGAGPPPSHDRLREELSRDGEQLLSDLSYMQHLFLGSGWLDETEGEGGDEPFHCVSPPFDLGGDQELVMYSDSEDAPPGVGLGTGRGEARSVDHFLSQCCLINVLPSAVLLRAADLEARWKLDERPSTNNAVKIGAKDRKRRHSASQRVASREVSLPGVLRSQTSCVKGMVSCPQFLLEHVMALRPVTL